MTLEAMGESRDIAMEPSGDVQDGMLVCRNGHVITDLLRSCPERALSHCDRCGATTLDRCPTCGRPLQGAVVVPGMSTLGTRVAPACCSSCGAPFPWAKATGPLAPADPLETLETFLRRLPQTIRQLRTRYADRPPFRVQDEHDLEDLLRAVLPLSCHAVRSESRTPSYAPGTRVDFRLGQESGSLTVALSAKLMHPRTTEDCLQKQWLEDIGYYERARDCEWLMGLVYDAEGLIRRPRDREGVWSQHPAAIRLRVIIAN
jgi:hypothetical protein